MKSSFLALICVLIIGCASAPVKDTKQSAYIEGVASTGATDMVGITPESVLSDQLVDDEGLSIPKYLPGYRYLWRPKNTSTEVPIWITRDDNPRFHVPWHVGGSWFDDTSDKVIVDPVNKTVSIGFEQFISTDARCSEDQRVSDRSVHGYFLCNSLFAEFKLVEDVDLGSDISSINGGSNTIMEPPSLWQKVAVYFEGDTSSENITLDVDADVGKPKIVDAPKMYDVMVNLERLALTVTQLNLLSKAERMLSGEAEPLDKLESRLIGKLNAAKNYYEKSLLTLQRKRINKYTEAAETKTLEVKQQTFDKSGYYNYDINWPMAVSIAPLPVDIIAFNYTAFVQEFKSYELNDASDALARLSLSKMKKQYSKDRTEVVRYINEATQRYKVNCDFPRVIGDYRVAVNCSEFATASEGAISVSLVYEVLAKRFDKVMPRYTNHNNDLTIMADSKTLSLTNNSDGELEIKGIEWLANNAAQSITRHTDKAKVFSIAQGQSVKISLNDSMSDNLKKELEVPYLSRRKALRKHLDYGFDVSYQVLEGEQAESTEVSRLNQTNRYGLNELLLGR